MSAKWQSRRRLQGTGMWIVPVLLASGNETEPAVMYCQVSMSISIRWEFVAPLPSRRRDCRFDDTPCLSLLKHLQKVQGGDHQMTVSPTAALAVPLPACHPAAARALLRPVPVQPLAVSDRQLHDGAALDDCSPCDRWACCCLAVGESSVISLTPPLHPYCNTC